ncbi:MAG: TIGR01212 family radical SAM protein [Treponema sp.]|uniref:TIGR01212 family radical SAM protein n=1 Tax=Treponema sp. TaxID=166 RepID=UPI00298E5469|nr:TIGR01212 family radical SAM protein [Treponema sp.]MCQ2599970.1 TIGR01212 family radical SAM protein [Treponema sp.]
MTYTSVSEYYKKIFGRKIYKITLDAGCTCPNRDGTKAVGGCIFCSATGSGDFAAERNFSISEQIENAKKLVANKIKNIDESKSNYIAYFQNFTNTYGDENSLIKKYREALENPQIAGIAIGTRPDCVGKSILERINELTKEQFKDGNTVGRKYFSIELGLQTSNEKSAGYIRRHYSNEDYIDAVKRIKEINPDIHIVTHVIFGLPGEDENDMLETVRFALKAGTDGLKLQVLNVLKGTDLAKDYEEGKFKVLEMDEYFLILKKALSIIPSDIVMHRLTGDGAKNILIEPQWIANKRKVMNELSKFLLK